MPLPTTSDLFNQLTPAAPSGDQNVVFVSDGGAPLQSITAYPKKATASLRGVVKPDGTTITVASDGTISATTATGVATQSGVQQESYTSATDTGSANAYAVTLTPVPTIGIYSEVTFKAAHANTGASTLAVNGGAATAINKNGNSPLLTGDIVAGQIVTCKYDGTYWQMTSAVAPALLVASTIRNSIQTDTFATALTLNLPTGSLAGDFAVLVCFNTGGHNNAPPSGWTTLTTSLRGTSVWNGFIASKILNSSDISAGSVTMNIQGPSFSLNSNGWAFMTTFVGATGGIREFPSAWGNCPGSNTVTTSSAVLGTDVGLFFSAAGVPSGGISNISVSPGTALLAPTNDANAVASVSSMTMPGGASTITFNSTSGSTTTGMGFGAIIVEGSAIGQGTVSSVGLSMPSEFSVSGSPVTSSGTLTVTANTQSANMVKAGPASGSPAAPTYRTIVPADLPAATTSALGAVKPDGSTITISGGVISASAGGISLTTLGSGAATLTGGVLNIPTPSGGGGGGAGAGTPFRFVQENLFGTNSNITSFTMTFPQALAASGNTAFILISCDGSQAVTTPSGWTVDFNQQQNTYARLILLHKTSAGDTSATFTIGSGSSFSAYFCEIAGSHALDQSALGGSNNVTPIQAGTITPTANSLLIVAAGIVTNASGTQGVSAGIINQANYTTFTIGSTAPGGRALCVAAARNPAANVATIPPALYLSGYSLFSGGGIAYAAFSIL